MSCGGDAGSEGCDNPVFPLSFPLSSSCLFLLQPVSSCAPMLPPGLKQHTVTFTHTGNLESQVNPVWMFLDCGRKLENLHTVLIIKASRDGDWHHMIWIKMDAWDLTTLETWPLSASLSAWVAPWPGLSSLSSAIKKKTAQQTTSLVLSKAKKGDAYTSAPTLADQATMEQILAEIKSLASRVNNMDESAGARLDIIDTEWNKSNCHLGGEVFIDSLYPSDRPGKAHGRGRGEGLCYREQLRCSRHLHSCCYAQPRGAETQHDLVLHLPQVPSSHKHRFSK